MNCRRRWKDGVISLSQLQRWRGNGKLRLNQIAIPKPANPLSASSSSFAALYPHQRPHQQFTNNYSRRYYSQENRNKYNQQRPSIMAAASSTVDLLAERLAAASLTPTLGAATVEHTAQTSPAEWRTALGGLSFGEPPKSYELLKTLVFKPRTAKTATPVPVLVVAGENAEVSASALGKALSLKELRLAAPELLTEFFEVDKDSISPLALSAASFPKVTTVIDTALATSDTIFAVHALAPNHTLFLSGAEIVAYLRALEAQSGGETKIKEVDFAALAAEAASTAGKPAKTESKPTAAAAAPKDDGKIDGAAEVGILYKKDVNFADWYTDVLRKSDMLDYYSVSGCYILKPWSYGIWESIQEWFNTKIKLMGVENAYFPMFVSSKVLEREKDHIEGFSPEVAWVTRAGQSELEEPIAIRPTSETAMYPYYAKWIQSHRDLPLKLNQWNSVVRWEFKNPQPFLRTREFLWQEGHTAHLTKKEADTEVREILDLYRRVYEELLAVPVVPGVKSEKEKFAGGLYTTTIEGFIPTTGRGIQAATSHCLGQNFSRPEMFNIVVEDPDAPKGATAEGKKSYAWQNSWGLSTRAIGVMVMVHGDDQGLVLPPRVAVTQAVVVPCGITAKTSAEARKELYERCEKLAKELREVGIRVKADLREGYTPGWKFNHWELKGVPLRLELGPADLSKSQTLAVRRDLGAKAPKVAIPLSSVRTAIPELLDTVHAEMLERARALYAERRRVVRKWEEVVPALEDKCVIVMPWCEREVCEDDVKERSGQSAEPQDARAPSAGAKSLCIPFDQSAYPAIEPGVTKCPACGQDAKRWTMFGRSY